MCINLEIEDLVTNDTNQLVISWRMHALKRYLKKDCLLAASVLLVNKCVICVKCICSSCVLTNNPADLVVRY